jgi:hypothetical protein
MANCEFPWKSSIMVRGRRILLGTFSSEREAARIYDAALHVFGGAASGKVNFPDEAPDQGLVERVMELSRAEKTGQSAVGKFL